MVQNAINLSMLTIFLRTITKYHFKISPFITKSINKKYLEQQDFYFSPIQIIYCYTLLKDQSVEMVVFGIFLFANRHLFIHALNAIVIIARMQYCYDSRRHVII